MYLRFYVIYFLPEPLLVRGVRFICYFITVSYKPSYIESCKLIIYPIFPPISPKGLWDSPRWGLVMKEIRLFFVYTFQPNGGLEVYYYFIIYLYDYTPSKVLGPDPEGRYPKQRSCSEGGKIYILLLPLTP